ncbi:MULTISPECIES: DUF975 family protein [unclassified Exiguobacterium]|uniref:DUF975 family protein n=3 Tax=Bacteria TaxID=2 RepID=A0A724WS54_SALEP|nr:MULTISPECIES: DUF975 family protein [unclassified Exiguobacterium]HAE0521168.1 DUF975 family protein [Salmonella enterica subsp. enterica serovar Enteritidis str. P125109]HBF58821.1 hypothetical protein [Exiguobacterium sp.]HCV52579.1 hypothetical protein [Exiguobacterium sp.]
MSSQLKKAAKESLSGRWGFAVLAFLLFSIIQGVPNLFGSDIDEPSSSIDLVVSLVSILLIPVGVGWTWIAMSIARGEETKVTDLFEPYGMFLKVVGLAIVQFIFIALWTLLLIIPGIIKSFSYLLTFYILRDEPSIGILEAITRSRQLMDGHKMEAFLLFLSFIGWALLVIVTLGLAVLWVGPYFSVTLAKFYDRVRGEQAPEPTSDFVAPY